MNSSEDSRIRKRFANVREEDRSAAPSFSRTAAASAVSSRHRGPWRIVLVAAPVLAIGAILAVQTRRSKTEAPHELAVWSSPTAFLLETPGKQLLNQTPRLGEPLIYVLPAAQDGPK